MKTSLIISGIAALLLMLTFAEAPSYREKNIPSAILNDEISFIRVNGIMPKSDSKKSGAKKITNTIAVPAIPAEDFSYLKFEVADYIETNDNTESYGEMPELSEQDFSYLKFDIDEYMSDSELTDGEAIDLPEMSANEFSYLRFDVNDYYASINTEAEGEAIELPEMSANEFSNLRFDVNDYYTVTYTETDELPQMEAENGATLQAVEPSSEYGYLKFSVNDYYNANEQTSTTSNEYELPE